MKTRVPDVLKELDDDWRKKRVEEAKLELRIQETEAVADACADCAQARAKSGDATDLCAEHLRRVMGV